ncbi:hypothetical protein ACFQ1M_04965 [Sungkyunkwania multivorans]|uniref:Uncharacterized protein n=1 Tax=Sungkyunkwania multivorans TaxID=1173618 RepID=A0ABW3CWV4_9FLAO
MVYKQTLNFHRGLIVVGIPLIMMVMTVAIARSSAFKTNPDLVSIGITVDLLLTVPIIYFLLIRRTSIPKTTIVPFVIMGVIVASLILPSENQFYLDLFKVWILPVVELSILWFLIYKLRKVVKRFNLERNESFDFFSTLKKSCYKILPRAIALAVATEIAVFYYGFISWKKRTLNDNEFTYHKNSGTISLLIAIIFIVAIETVTFHILIAKWNDSVAWIFTALSIYSDIQIFGFLRSMLQRPISIENNRLYLRYGMMSEATIALDTIGAIELSSKEIEFDKETRKLSVLGTLESYNVIIRLNEEATLVRLYGIKRTYKNLAIYVDDRIKFKDELYDLKTSSVRDDN